MDEGGERTKESEDVEEEGGSDSAPEDRMADTEAVEEALVDATDADGVGPLHDDEGVEGEGVGLLLRE